MKNLNLEISNPKRENLHIKMTKDKTRSDFLTLLYAIPFAAPHYSFNDAILSNKRIEVSTEDYERVLDFDVDMVNYFGLGLVKVHDETNKETRAFPTVTDAMDYIARALEKQAKELQEGTNDIL